MLYAIAVIDIGMTNKKIAIYDNNLNQIDAVYRTFDPLMVNGLQTHNLDVMELWFICELKNFAQKYPVKVISVTAHGATFVCAGKDGKAALPCVYYTHEPGEDFHDEFYDLFGNPDHLQQRTGTPSFKALINPAKGLYFIQKYYKDKFSDVCAILPYPQYWGFRFTGKTGGEGTYMGNHTYLWDYMDNCLSSVAEKMGIKNLLPDKLHNSWDTLGCVSSDFAAQTGLDEDTIVTMGIHDSNSAMLPHFAKKGEKGFVLNSTGTWCVIMNPVEQYGYSGDEIGKVVLFNISAFGTPIKTAIFLGGLEFETWSSVFLKKHSKNNPPAWNEELYRSILKDKNIFLLPELTKGSGQFPHSKARINEDGKNYFFDDIEGCPCLDDFEKSFAVLRISLVMQTMTAMERTGIKNGQDIYTEGGFRRDDSYNKLLAAAFPFNKVFLTNILEATALGAAITGKMSYSGKLLKGLSYDFTIDYKEQEKNHFPELEDYRIAWLKEAEKLL
jgi:sugar (pentulose or hexulose) kinase